MRAERRVRAWVLLAVFVAAALAQAAIALNPGWFSHDELQWGARADVAALADLPWMGWFDVGQFQYRPLTFNLWLPIAQALFATPVAWHVLWVVAGSAIAAGLAALLLRLGVAPRVAVGAALAFALSPYAVQVHGWVATLADLLVATFALALAHGLLTLQRRETPARAAAFALALVATGLALLAKESAIAFPAVLAVLALAWPRERLLWPACAGAAAIAAVYLALRLPVMLAAPGDAAAYAVDVAAAPRNWLAYHLFVLRPSTFELPGLWRASTGALALAGLFWLLLWALLARASWRLALATVAGGALWLAPVLPIAMTANHYGYVFAAWTAGGVALAWSRFGRGAKAFVALFAVVVVWHGANVQRQLRAAGERQAVFQPALVRALATHEGELQLYVDPDEAWLYRRLTHDVASYHGAPIGDRVRWVDSPAAADRIVAPDGSL